MEHTGKGKWVRRSERERRAVVSRYERSGMELEAFCQREGISAASLYRWRRTVGRAPSQRLAPAAESAPRFVDLGALTARGRALELKLDLGDGLVLHLVRG